MGSLKFFKSIFGLKRSKQRNKKIKKPKDSKKNGTRSSSLAIRGEDWAATRIQAAFKAYKARKSLPRLKGAGRLKLLTEEKSLKKQVVVTLKFLHSWSKIQSQIKARRAFMVAEGQLKHKRLETYQKIEARLHEVEVKWNCGSETKDGMLGRIYQREEAKIKRERALAYAFSHQWKANGKIKWLGSYELGNTSWGWSWKDRWIYARPWEVRYSMTRKKPKSSKTFCGKYETSSNSPGKRIVSLHSSLSKSPVVKPGRLSFSGA